MGYRGRSDRRHILWRSFDGLRSGQLHAAAKRARPCPKVSSSTADGASRHASSAPVQLCCAAEPGCCTNSALGSDLVKRYPNFQTLVISPEHEKTAWIDPPPQKKIKDQSLLNISGPLCAIASKTSKCGALEWRTCRFCKAARLSQWSSMSQLWA